MASQADSWFSNSLYLDIPGFESMVPNNGPNIHSGHPGSNFLQHGSQPNARPYTVRELSELTKYLPQEKFLKVLFLL